MGLGVPGEVVSIHGASAVIECWGVRRVVAVEKAGETIFPGDYVIAHEGLVVRRIPRDDVDQTLALYEAVLAEA